jgi:hypothetical protein
MITSAGFGTLTNGILQITSVMGVARISIEVTSGSVTLTGSFFGIPATSLTSTSITIQSTDAITALTFGGYGNIDGVTIDASTGTVKIISYAN